MTTSFAHFVRGEFADAARANAAGLLLAVLLAVQLPWCWMSIYHRRMLGVQRPEIIFVCLLAIVCGVGIVQWICRLAV